MVVILLQSLTKNESRVIDFLLRNFREKNSINAIARRLDLSSRGAYKILKKLEKSKAIAPEKIGNAIYYKINLNEEIGVKLSEFILMQNELNAYLQIQAEDLMLLKNVSLSCVLFGSVLTKGKEAKDIDVLIVLEKKDVKKVSLVIDKIKSLKPKRIHEVLQTKDDLVKNIKKNDEVISDIIRTGKVLWGAEIILEAIKNGTG